MVMENHATGKIFEAMGKTTRAKARDREYVRVRFHEILIKVGVSCSIAGRSESALKKI